MPTRHRLENGLTLVHEPQGAAHVVAFQIWVNVGGADEREDEAGLAHLHEHMLFKGTARRGPGDGRPRSFSRLPADRGFIPGWLSQRLGGAQRLCGH